MPLCVCVHLKQIFISYMWFTWYIYYTHIFDQQTCISDPEFKIPLFLNFSKKKRNIAKTMVLLRQLSSHTLKMKYLRPFLFFKNTVWMSLRNSRPTGLQTLLVCLELNQGEYSVLSTHCLGLCRLT